MSMSTTSLPDAGCALPSEPEGIPAALDAAITGPADKDRACVRSIFLPRGQRAMPAHALTTKSISTQAPSGKAATPITVRAGKG